MRNSLSRFSTTGWDELREMWPVIRYTVYGMNLMLWLKTFPYSASTDSGNGAPSVRVDEDGEDSTEGPASNAQMKRVVAGYQSIISAHEQAASFAPAVAENPEVWCP
ncbi:hypothetical protein FOZ62_030867, partial [Perkinsus olseni]